MIETQSPAGVGDIDMLLMAYATRTEDIMNDVSSEDSLVSVIIPVFNRTDLLHRSLASVVAQEYQHIEVLVIDDCSTIDLRPVVDGFGDERIKYHRSNVNQGPAGARNAGVRLARGEYIAFLDSDDEWKANKVGAQLKGLSVKSSDYRFIYCMREQWRDDTDTIVDRSTYNKEGYILHDLLYYPFIGSPSSWFMQKSAFLEAGGFDERIWFGEDWEFTLRFNKTYKVAYLDEPLVKLHEHGQERLTANLDSNPRVLSSFITIYEKHKDLLKSDRKALALILQKISYYLRQQGDSKGARRYAWKAILARPTSRQPYQYLAASFRPVPSPAVSGKNT